MEYYKVKQTDLVAEIEKNIHGGFHMAGYTLIETPVVFVHEVKQVDKDDCTKLGYEVSVARYNGGVIVGNKGDVAIIHFQKINNGWYHRFVSCFINWLKEKGLNVFYDGNDILVDGYKVCGMAVVRYGRIDYTAGFISMNPNMEHIKALCKKPMEKVPKGLRDYGITTEEVEQMFLNFCEQDEQN